jgi:hypothetical protein
VLAGRDGCQVDVVLHPQPAFRPETVSGLPSRWRSVATDRRRGASLGDRAAAGLRGSLARETQRQRPYTRVKVARQKHGALIVTTWNVENFTTASPGYAAKLAHLTTTLRVLDPDVIALQEILDTDALTELASSLGRHAIGAQGVEAINE